ncbi:asparagine synthase (glutamine-hydrolyzing) [Flavobacterium humi]|uniref:asparagine synthase (glutamine-hydrolyzing) n=1 Tax=Flavobacterium humi TaxID=2562683 RepID=A0A4Z0L823_9FLAO|nr:asparagine synthase (glutamine-hydrolyzing) [Flavobacterium humi]TGD57134.1 asparagine synthase (glutamine-hydrolyzing) [Flavobacterium humi]
MCGINGFITNLELNKSNGLSVLDEMNHLIRHRGPDEDGSFFDQSDSYSVGMAMQRLSIIDLSTGKQPIFSEDGQKVIVFNGEIYNYPVIKDDLLERGVIFTTTSDTEVILKLYELEGPSSFSKLDGMFAFSIYDKTIGKLFIARDYFGEKPLYYTVQGQSLYWASELKSIVKVLPKKMEICHKGLNLFFQLSYIPAPFTIYKGIKKLNVNHYLEIDCKNLSVKEKEIPAVTHTDYKGISKIEAISLTARKVRESVKSRSIADVSLGTFLSGGVDSSIVSLCLAEQSSQKIDTFSIGFEKKEFDESEKARAVSKLIGSQHHELIISEKDLEKDLYKIILNFDEPFADSSALPTYLVSQLASGSVKVALTGDGGDEVFGGYNKYFMGRLNQKYTNLVPKAVHHFGQDKVQKLLRVHEDSRGIKFKVNRLVKAINYEGDFYLNIISLAFQSNELPKILKPDYLLEDSFNYYKESIGDQNKTLTDFRNIDRRMSLEGDLLVKVDRTSMLNSIECRSPYLNQELWHFTSQLPESFLIKGWDKKHILKEAFKEHFPNDFLDKNKKGFGVPVGDWLRTHLQKELLSYIDPGFIKKQQIFQLEAVSKLVEQHISKQVDNTFRVWTFYCFQLWYKTTFQD